jgi:hypothetical protein
LENEELFEDEDEDDNDDDEEEIEEEEDQTLDTNDDKEYHKNRGLHSNKLNKSKSKQSDNLSIIIEKFKGNSSKLMKTIDQLDEVLEIENDSNTDSNVIRSKPVQKSNFNQNKALSKHIYIRFKIQNYILIIFVTTVSSYFKNVINQLTSTPKINLDQGPPSPVTLSAIKPFSNSNKLIQKPSISSHIQLNSSPIQSLPIYSTPISAANLNHRPDRLNDPNNLNDDRSTLPILKGISPFLKSSKFVECFNITENENVSPNTKPKSKIINKNKAQPSMLDLVREKNLLQNDLSQIVLKQPPAKNNTMTITTTTKSTTILTSESKSTNRESTQQISRFRAQSFLEKESFGTIDLPPALSPPSFESTPLQSSIKPILQEFTTQIQSPFSKKLQNCETPSLKINDRSNNKNDDKCMNRTLTRSPPIPLIIHDKPYILIEAYSPSNQVPTDINETIEFVNEQNNNFHAADTEMEKINDHDEDDDVSIIAIKYAEKREKIERPESEDNGVQIGEDKKMKLIVRKNELKEAYRESLRNEDFEKIKVPVIRQDSHLTSDKQLEKSAQLEIKDKIQNQIISPVSTENRSDQRDLENMDDRSNPNGTKNSIFKKDSTKETREEKMPEKVVEKAKYATESRTKAKSNKKPKIQDTSEDEDEEDTTSPNQNEQVLETGKNRFKEKLHEKSSVEKKSSKNLRVTFRESSDDEIDAYYKKKVEDLAKNKKKQNVNRAYQKELLQSESEEDNLVLKPNKNKNLKINSKIRSESESETEDDEFLETKVKEKETDCYKSKENQYKIRHETQKDRSEKCKKAKCIIDSSDDEAEDDDDETSKSHIKITKGLKQKPRHQQQISNKKRSLNEYSSEEQSDKENIRFRENKNKNDSKLNKNEAKKLNTLNFKKADVAAKHNKKSPVKNKSYKRKSKRHFEGDSSTDLSDECFDDIIMMEEEEKKQTRHIESKTKHKESSVQFATPVAPVGEFLAKNKISHTSQSTERTPIIIKINKNQNKSTMNDTRNLSIQLCQSIMSNSRINQSSTSNMSNLTANSSAFNSSKKQIVIKKNSFNVTSNMSKTTASDLSTTSSTTSTTTSNAKRKDFMKEMLVKAARNK